jgi:hypothetical protein
MIAAWVIKDAEGATIAAGTVRDVTPQDAAGAYELAQRVAHGVEAGLIEYLGPQEGELPLLAAAE